MRAKSPHSETRIDSESSVTNTVSCFFGSRFASIATIPI